ncbi:P450 monooxygenase [Lecanosticta acicola]|uniref:P450 monooxygenase n=1 Tax=Lecanosticta acicola TaxID=111012 RepID=A0AAI9EEM9_9PEZI|nr:P450 monooxygenase [Lecanosticta acicola]
MGLLSILENHPVVAIAGALLIVYKILSAWLAKSPTMPDLPWSGSHKSKLEILKRGRTWMTEGYQKYAKNGKSHILPDISGTKFIMIPNEKAQWMFDHSDIQLSVGAAHYDQLAGDYSFTNPEVLGKLYHEHVIHRNLARKLQVIIPEIWDEVQACFNDLWGNDTEEWKDIVVFESITAMVARLSNRLLVGLPLCRNEKFLKANAAFAQDVINCLIANQLIPDILKSVLMPIAALPNNYHYWQTRKYTLPIIKQRIADIEEQERNPDVKIKIPEDYFTWHIRLAKSEGKVRESEPDFISRAVLGIEFAALHTTSITGTNALFDLAGSNPSVLAGIREEVERVYEEANGVWTKQELNKLLRTDSALRETMRNNDITPHTTRKVVAKDGVRNAEEGWTAPYGSSIAVNNADRHHDPDIYPSPNQYDAFRFSRPREAFQASGSNMGEQEKMEFLKLQNTSFTSTSENFLPFGHGRHACPGRFFVQQELKMVLAYMVMNYDIEPLPGRPASTLFGMTLVPPMKAKIRVKRRATKT